MEGARIVRRWQSCRSQTRAPSQDEKRHQIKTCNSRAVRPDESQTTENRRSSLHNGASDRAELGSSAGFDLRRACVKGQIEQTSESLYRTFFPFKRGRA